MPAIGGSIEAITVAGRIFPVTADAEVQRKLGGFENEVQANGDGSARKIQTRIPWSLDGLVIEIDDDRGDQEFLQGIVNLKDYSVIAITFVSGAVYSGLGTIIGEMPGSSQSTTAAVSLMGPGDLAKQ